MENTLLIMLKFTNNLTICNNMLYLRCELDRMNIKSTNFSIPLADLYNITIFALLNSIMKKAILKTEKGDMTLEFFEKDAPNTVDNFLKLAKEGFYDGVTFHRVIPDFVVQAGCPFSKSETTAFRAGTGGPGYHIKCELDGDHQYHDRGVLSMAHAGRDTGGSQFFICHSRTNTAHLDRNHTVFGKVVDNVDLIDAIRQGDRITGIEVIEQ